MNIFHDIGYHISLNDADTDNDAEVDNHAEFGNDNEVSMVKVK